MTCGVQGQVTTVDECNRDATKVPAALGLKSTSAPLFKVEKLFKAALLSGADLDIDKWNEATDQFVQHSTSAQEYAYTASFGERAPRAPRKRLCQSDAKGPRRYNPSGGKDQISKYMDLSKDELILARNALKDVLTQLGVGL